MADDIDLTPKCIEAVRRSWLRPAIDSFLTHLSAQRYSKKTLRRYCSRLIAFGEFMARKRVRTIDQLPRWVAPFVTEARITDYSRGKWHLFFARFISHLRRNNLIPPPTSPAPSAAMLLVDSYVQFLRDLRGLSDNTLASSRLVCRSLITFMSAGGVEKFEDLRPDAIDRFIVRQGKHCNRHTLRNYCSSLRGFLAFLHQRKTITVDLASALAVPRPYQNEQCPRFMTLPEIEAVLAAIDRSTPLGRRNYAMLSLLGVYGLRGGEVVRLRLDEIDWRNERFQIRRRKAGNNTSYPLSIPVGEALLAYLQNGRPASPHREVFLRTMAPFTRLASSASLNFWVKRYVSLAGIQMARPGTHSFRYSCAQRLFDQSVPLKSIGDYLGHRQPATTQRYTSIALTQLREVAMGDGEDLL